MNLTYLSVCSGIEAATVAWHPLGWKPLAFSEIEKFPSSVLAHHYPTVPNLGDMTTMDVEPLGRVDILVGGTPCQAFSVAGLRQSLNDARGNLTLSYVRLAHELVEEHGLRNLVWENVPGVLSTKDNAFGCFLGALVGSDGPLDTPDGKRWPNSGMVSGPKGRAAWTIKDAQYFGVAQRRRRVFVVADFGNGADPAAVLFEREGVLGNPAPSREARKDVAPTISARTKGGGGLGTDFDLDGGLIAGDVPEVSPAMKARGYKGVSSDGDGDGLPVIPMFSTHAIQAGALRENPNSGPDGVGVQADLAYTLEARAEVQAVSVTGEISHTLKAEGFDASEDGTGRGNPIIAFSSKDYGADAGELAPTLRAGGHSESHANAGVPPAIAFVQNSRSEVRLVGGDGSHTGALAAEPGVQQQHYVQVHSAVRRLTPMECERLQGFPDAYTKISDKTADGPRYKALGNSMAVPVMHWIGARIDRLMPRDERVRKPAFNFGRLI